MADTAKKKESLSMERLKAKIAKRNAKVMTNDRMRRLQMAKVVK